MRRCVSRGVNQDRVTACGLRRVALRAASSLPPQEALHNHLGQMGHALVFSLLLSLFSSACMSIKLRTRAATKVPCRGSESGGQVRAESPYLSSTLQSTAFSVEYAN